MPEGWRRWLGHTEPDVIDGLHSIAGEESDVDVGALLAGKEMQLNGLTEVGRLFSQPGWRYLMEETEAQIAYESKQLTTVALEVVPLVRVRLIYLHWLADTHVRVGKQIAQLQAEIRELRIETDEEGEP